MLQYPSQLQQLTLGAISAATHNWQPPHITPEGSGPNFLCGGDSLAHKLLERSDATLMVNILMHCGLEFENKALQIFSKGLQRGMYKWPANLDTHLKDTFQQM